MNAYYNTEVTRTSGCRTEDLDISESSARVVNIDTKQFLLNGRGRKKNPELY